LKAVRTVAELSAPALWLLAVPAVLSSQMTVAARVEQRPQTARPVQR
jgi:hypothetical protein